MADILRIVTLDVGGRPSTVLDLNDMSTLMTTAGSFQVTPGMKQRVDSNSERRHGGSHQVAEADENGKVAWRAFVQGETADGCIATAKSLVANLQANPAELWLEWRPDGASLSALYEIRGTSDWTPLYEWKAFAGAKFMLFDVQIPVAPLASGLPMDILDGFAVDTRGDYTYDAGSSLMEAVAGGLLTYTPAARYAERVRSLPGLVSYWRLGEAEPVEVVNLIPNPDAESASVGTTGWQSGFKTGAISRSTERAYLGTASFKVTPIAGEKEVFFSTSPAVKPWVLGKKYCARAAVYIPAAGNWSVTLRNPQSLFQVASDGGAFTVVAPGWFELTWTNFTYNKEDASNEFVIVVGHQGGTLTETEFVYIDKIQMAEGETLPSFATGETAGRIWSGKPYESTTLTAPAAADSFGANPGEYTGGITLGESGLLTGDLATSVKLDGATGYVIVPNSSSLNMAAGGSAFAIIKPTTGGSQVIFQKGGPFSEHAGWKLLLAGTALTLQVGYGGAMHEVSAPTAITSGVVQVVGFTLNGTTAKLYVNGTVVAEAAISNPAATTSPLGLGANSGATTERLNGSLQEAFLGGQAISQQEVTELYETSIAAIRAIHTARGYKYADNQQTLKATPGTTISGFKAGVDLKRVDPADHLAVYVDDNGTNSRLRIDKVVAGARTNLASVNLTSRIATGTAFWVRGRIEGNAITAAYFTSAPTPMGAPTSTVSYTLTAGAEREAFGAGVKGSPGRTWTPVSTNATLDEYSVEQYVYRNRALPEAILLGGSIPGDAPAKADITITPSGGSAAPIWALLGWAKNNGAGLAKAPFGLLEAESASNLSGWSVEADGTAHEASMLKDTSALSSDVYSASWSVDPSLLSPDDFSSEVAVEVWARVMLASTIVSPNLVLSVRPEDGLSFGSARYTDEWGSAGKLLVTPSSGTGIWRMVRLGTIHMLVDRLRPRRWLVWLSGSVGATTSGAWGIDYLLLVPAAQRASSPVNKANDSTFPTFVASTAETSKTIKSNLSALVAKPPAYGHPDHGLGGQRIELPPGEVELLAKLSSLVPDDPTSSAATEQLSHSATVHVAVTPRWYLTRSS